MGKTNEGGKTIIPVKPIKQIKQVQYNQVKPVKRQTGKMIN